MLSRMRRPRNLRRLQPSCKPSVRNSPFDWSIAVKLPSLLGSNYDVHTAQIKQNLISFNTVHSQLGAESYDQQVFQCSSCLSIHAAGSPVLVAQFAESVNGASGRVYLPPDAMHAERISAGELLAVGFLLTC